MAQLELYERISIIFSESSCENKLKLFIYDELPHDFYSFEKSKEYFDNGGPKKQLGGLLNIGYNCYMNSVLQCLLYTPGFPQFCLSLPNILYQKLENKPFFLDSFAHLYSELEKNRSIYPTWFLQDSGFIHESFKKPIQQDAHEYLLALLSIMEKECRSAFSQINSNSDTLITHYFSGNNRSIIECKNCHLITQINSKFYDIQFPFNQYEDLQQGITFMTNKREFLLTNQCHSCKFNNCMIKSTLINKFPLILMITMLRFNNNLKKLEDFIKYPEILLIGENKLNYKLYALIVHEGRFITHGHFIAYIRDQNDIWYKADDVCIYRVKEEFVMNLSPYVLFYKKN